MATLYKFSKNHSTVYLQWVICMICKLGLNNAFVNGEQKEYRKVDVEQMPMDKVYQFKT